MIRLTKRDGSMIYLNPDLIEAVEETPDTHITLVNGNHFLVLEKARVIVDKIVVFKAGIMRRADVSHKQKYLHKRREASYRPACSLDPPGQ